MFEKIISKTPENQPHSPAPTAPSATTPPPAAGRPAAEAPVSAAPSRPSSAPSGQRNILSNDVEIKGTVRFQNDLLVDGKIEGEITSDGSLTVAENAHIKAEIKTRSVVIYGKVHGNIIATERVEVKSKAELVGDIKSPTLLIEPGAIFVGKSEVGTPSAQPKPAAAPANKPATAGEVK